MTEEETLTVETVNAETTAADPAPVPDRKNDTDEELAARESDVRNRELKLEVAERLRADGLPMQLADCIDRSDPDKCAKSYDAVARAFAEAVSRSVADRFGSAVPKRADMPPADPFLAGLGIVPGK